MTDNSNLPASALRQTVFHVEASLYSFDVKPTVTIYDLRKILAAAAHLPKNSFNIYYEKEDLSPFEESTLESLFPSELQIHFTITIDADISKLKEPIINLNLDKYCPYHRNKFLIYYYYDCKTSICSVCYSQSHLNHKIIEKYDYLRPTCKLVDHMFEITDTRNYRNLYSVKDENDRSASMYELQDKLKNVLFSKLHEMLNEVDKKVNDVIMFFNTSSEIAKINIEHNSNNIKEFCIEGLEQLKKEINIRNIVNNEEIFLTFDKKYKELNSLKTRLENDNNKFKTLNLNYETIEQLVNDTYKDIESVLNDKLNLTIYDIIKQNIQSNLVNQITKDEIIEFIFNDIQCPTRTSMRKSLTKSARNSSTHFHIDNDINNNIAKTVILSNNTQPQLPSSVNNDFSKEQNASNHKEQQYSFSQILHNEIEKVSQLNNSEIEYLMFPLKNQSRILIYNGDEHNVKNESINFPVFCKIQEFFENSAHCNYKNKLYISGGIDKTTSETSNILLKYDPNYNTIISLAALPSPHQCHSMLAHNDKLYIIGGKHTNACEIYNFNTLKFEQMSSMIFDERQWPMLVVFNKFLYAFLGVSEEGYMKSVERINVNNPKAKWELVPFKNEDDVLLEKYGCGLMMKEEMSTLFFFGGRNEREVFSNVFNFSFEDLSFNDCNEQCKETMYFKENQLHLINSNYCNFNEEKGTITQFNIKCTTNKTD